MLKGIPSIISPELLKILDEMGHGDEIVLADGNFPGMSIAAAKGHTLLRADGHGVCELLEAILQVFPLDTYDQPVYIMERVPNDTLPGHEVPVPIWDDFRRIIGPYTDADLGKIERFAFYERAKDAFAVVQTGEGAQYANLILKKGVVV